MTARGGRRIRLGATLAAGVAAGVTGTAGGEDEARRLVAAAQARVLVIGWSPLNTMRITMAPGGRMRVVGFGLHHCDGPRPGLCPGSPTAGSASPRRGPAGASTWLWRATPSG